MSMPRARSTRPTDSELEILSILWDKGECTVRDLWDVLNAASPIDRTSVAKRVESMVKKRQIAVVDARRPQKVRALVDRKAAYQSYTRDLIRRFFGDPTDKLIMHIQQLKKPLSKAERQKILDEIDKME